MKFKLMSVALMSMTMTACSFEKVINFIKEVGIVVQAIAIVFSWFPPASDLQNFDAHLATQNLTVQNISITSSSGTVEITIKDENDGTLLGQNSFGYQINAQNQIQFSDPTLVTNWVRSFSNYNGFVEVEVRTIVDVQAPPVGQSGTVSSTSVYNGSPVASASSTYTNEGSGCGAGFCDEQ
jgi:hypothetical protein